MSSTDSGMFHLQPIRDVADAPESGMGKLDSSLDDIIRSEVATSSSTQQDLPQLPKQQHGREGTGRQPKNGRSNSNRFVENGSTSFQRTTGRRYGSHPYQPMNVPVSQHPWARMHHYAGNGGGGQYRVNGHGGGAYWPPVDAVRGYAFAGGGGGYDPPIPPPPPKHVSLEDKTLLQTQLYEDMEDSNVLVIQFKTTRVLELNKATSMLVC
eukprot:GHVU01138579.1.p1 GENE.GHVU01138579.1~~GHVU01138579.1.p1  ORF type:complete len:210 (+),score=23.02 GHVU01138579.1:225-854(+)